MLESNPEDSSKIEDLEDPDWHLDQISADELPDQGTTVTITFDDSRLLSLLGKDSSVAKQRLNYFLRTRTGIGFHIAEGDQANLEDWQRRLRVEATVRSGGGEEKWTLEPGYFYPHIQAKAKAQKTSLFSASTKNNELLYEFFDTSWMKKNFLDDGKKRTLTQAHLEALAKVKATGYFAYAHQNQWFEETAKGLLTLPEDTDEGGLTLNEALVQVNGGFVVAVRDFPTGRKKSFLHRSGAEHKSRTFVLLNFSGDYKPDYGRKNLGAAVHEAVLALCKDLIAYAVTKKDMLLIGTQQAVHGATSTADAQETLREKGEALKRRGKFFISGRYALERAPITETELIADFLRLVASNELPGFDIYGLSATGIYDGFFDFDARPEDTDFVYDEMTNELGLSFKEGRPRVYRDQWLEFKVKSDQLIDDFNKQPGEPGKKFFTLLDLLICESTDDATEGFGLEKITPENYDERTYFGVTHLMTSSGNAEHVIQVICLADLRRVLGAQAVTPAGD